MAKIRLALIAGGTSDEREVSLRGAAGVEKALDPNKYSIVRYDPATDLAKIANEATSIDVAFLLLHGVNGEDGTIQGFLDLLGIPYQGAGVLGSALAMDKNLAKIMYQLAGLPVAPWVMVEPGDLADTRRIVSEVGLPCVVKPVMSSSGKGQSTLRSESDIDPAWDYAQTGGRAGAGRCIVEGFIDFDYEITLLTVRHAGGTAFCEPIGHWQKDGDYRESWQPQPMSPRALERAQQIARAVTDDLGGWGLFGVELFVKGDEVWFSEVSPRPHDTGLVTLASQELSEFALHARAILGLPIPVIRQSGPSASCAMLAHGHGVPVFGNVEGALEEPDTALRLFGKPRVEGHRRVGVTLARGEDVDIARSKARAAAAAITIELK